jgi:hypothetical protein
VQQVTVDNTAKTATVTVKPGASLARDRAEAALQPRYGVTSFTEVKPPSGS